jgi:hypothetical protein
MIEVVRETHDTPEQVAAAVERAGGYNTFGEPNFRVVWSMNRLELIGGRWFDYDNSHNQLRSVIEMRRVPKYWLNPNRWILEIWVPAEMYGPPEFWDYSTRGDEEEGYMLQLGPYPERGEYEQSFTLETNGEFAPLTADGMTRTLRAVKWAKAQGNAARWNAIKNRVETADKRYASRDESILHDARSAFHGQIFNTIPANIAANGTVIKEKNVS